MYPVKIHGVTYPSTAEAARRLGMSAANIRRALNAGRVDFLGSGHGGAQAVRVLVDGEEVRSMNAAARLIGVSVSSITRLHRQAPAGVTISYRGHTVFFGERGDE